MTLNLSRYLYSYRNYDFLRLIANLFSYFNYELGINDDNKAFLKGHSYFCLQ